MQLRPITTLALVAAVGLGLSGCMASTPADEEAPAATEVQEDASTAPEAAETGAEDAAEPAADAPIDGWPAEVPVPEGDLEQDASNDAQIVGAFRVADASAGEAYAAELEAAGFTPMEGAPSEIAGVEANVYEGAGHMVATSIVEAGDVVLLSVAIQPM